MGGKNLSVKFVRSPGRIAAFKRGIEEAMLLKSGQLIDLTHCQRKAFQAALGYEPCRCEKCVALRRREAVNGAKFRDPKAPGAYSE